MRKICFLLLFGVVLFLSGCKVGAGCALPFAAIGDTLVAPLNGCEWVSDKLIQLGDDHQVKVYEETRNTTYGDLAAYTAWVYYLPGYLFWPAGALAPSELYPMTKACMKTIKGENTEEAKVSEANERYGTYKKIKEREKEEEDFEEW